MRFLLTYLLIIVSCFLSAQGGFRTKYVLPNSINNTSKFIFETTPGNYIAGGFIVDSLNGFNYSRLVIMSLNQSGQVQWTKKYGNKYLEHLDNIFISRSFYKQNNYILYAGCVRDTNNKQMGVFIKFNAFGDTLWQKIFRDTAQDVIPQMCTESADGGYLITGFYQDWINHTQAGLLIKTDANGNELWRKIINKNVPNVMDGKAIIQDSASKKIIIVGYQYVGNQSSWDMTTNLIFLDSLGNKLYQYGFAHGNLLDLIQTKDKKFVAVGNRIVNIIPNFLDHSYSYAFKFDINYPGQVIWQITNFDKLTSGNYFSCLTELPNGNVLLAGTIDTAEAITGTLQTLNRYTEISPNGTIVSNKYYNYAINDSTFNNNTVLSINNTSDGGWITALRVTNGVNPFFFVKYDSTGCDSSLAYCKMMQEVGLNKVSAQFDFTFDMFPNPTTDKVNFILQAPGDKKLSLKVSDVSGKKIETLHFEANTPIAMQTSNYEAGLYFVNLVYEGKTIETKKLIIVR